MSIGQDARAGVSVAAVLLPQSLAYAELAGVPAARGLTAAAVAAIVASGLGSSRQLQTGPTALASLLTFGVLTGAATPFSDDWIALAAILAIQVGLLRLALGLARLGAISTALSTPVVTGLSLGAGILIVATQVPALTGIDATHANPLLGAVTGIVDDPSPDLAAIVIGALGLTVMLGLRPYAARVPIALATLVVGGLAALAFDDVARVSLTGASLGFAVDADVLRQSLRLLPSAAVIAIVGFAEAAAIARRFATQDRERWEPSRELVGQGAACLAAGVAGGFPVSGSFSRSALNRMAGAASRRAGIVTGVLALALLPIAERLPSIPSAALAAVVAASGLSLVNRRDMRRLRRHARLQWLVACATTTLAVVLAPRIDLAIALAVLFALVAHVYREARIHVIDRWDGETLHVRIAGVLFYMSAANAADRLRNLIAAHPGAQRLEVDLSTVGRVDLSGAMALADALDEFEEFGVHCKVVGVTRPARKLVGRVLADHLDDEHETPVRPDPRAG